MDVQEREIRLQKNIKIFDIIRTLSENRKVNIYMASNYKTGASLNLTPFEMQLLSRSPLFRGAGESGIGEMLFCLGAEERSYEKEEMIYRAGNTVTSLGVVMHGSVMIVNDDLWGNRSILDRVEPGQIFAETYACVPGEKLLVDVFAAEVTEVLFLNVGKMLSQCPNSCGHHTQLIRNLLAISAQKNLQLSRRIFNTSSKSIRGRLLSYLSDQAVKNESERFDIPFNRQQLADYLGVDRSALSAELGKMQREGLLEFRKNHFHLYEEVRSL